MLRFYANMNVLQAEVTGSAIPVTIYFPDNTEVSFLVDYGMFQEKNYTERNREKFSELEKLDFVLITHAHIDHVGRLPFLVKQGYEKKIYMTQVTKALSYIALNESIKIDGIKNSGNPKMMLYNKADFYKTMKQIEVVEYRKTFSPVPFVNVTFYENGHLPGAAVIHVEAWHPECEETIDLLFLGDYKKDNILEVTPDFPQELLQRRVNIITESTYGNTNSWEIPHVWKENMIRFLSEGKSIILPAISNYRLQERQYAYKKLVEEHPEFKKVRTYIEAKLSEKFSIVYKNPYYHFREDGMNFEPTNLIHIAENTRNAVFKDNKQKVIFTSSGDATNGAAAVYVGHYLSNKNYVIYLTSYQFEGSVGQSCLQAKQGELVNLGGRMCTKQAEVLVTSECSGHDKADELINVFNQFPNKQSILINHGEESVQEIFLKRIEKDCKVKGVARMKPKTTIKIGPYGIIKTFESTN